jgi:hypothetical protein
MRSDFDLDRPRLRPRTKWAGQQLRQPITRESLLNANVRPSFRRIVEEIDREIQAEHQ